MKNLGKTPMIIIAIIAAILLITAIIAFVVHKSNKRQAGSDAGNNKPAVTTPATGYNVAGAWYSDQENSDTLTLNKDGSYTSSHWLAAGKYVVQDGIVSLTDNFGTTKELTIQKVGKNYVLFFDNANKSFSYHRTPEEVAVAKQEQKQQEDDMQKMYNAALMQILTTGPWKDNTGTSTLTFTDTEYNLVSVSYLTGEKNAEETYQYAIKDVAVEDNIYKIQWDTINKKTGAKASIHDVTITVKDNKYTISSNWAFPFANNFTKTVDIVFDQPTATAEPPQQNTSPAPKEQSTNEEIRQKVDGDLEGTVKREIVGTWKGTYDVQPTDSTIYWIYTFTADGKYTFSNGEINESGTYTLSYNAGQHYHSTLHLVPASGTQRSINFYLAGVKPVELVVEGTDPRYTKM